MRMGVEEKARLKLMTKRKIGNRRSKLVAVHSGWQ
jgi:hypothetical protein